MALESLTRITSVGIATDVTLGGISTFSADGVDVTGVITATSFKGDGSALAGIGGTANVRTSDLVVTGVSTFTGAVDINNNVDVSGFIDVDGQTTLDDLNVAGVSTFTGAVDINNNVDVSGFIDIDGQTTLDDLNVAGVSTFADQVKITKAATPLIANTLTTNPAIEIQRSGTAKGWITPSSGELQIETNGSEDIGLQCNASGGTAGDIHLRSGSAALLTVKGAGNVDITNQLNVNNINVSAGGTFGGNLTVGGALQYEDVVNIDSIGIVTARTGVHIDDSITHIGDTNTKIRFPAADTFSVETGGSERLRITSAGGVHIGNTLSAHSEGDDLVVGGAGWRGMTIYGEGGGGVIQFADDGDNRRGQILYSHGEDSMIFRVAGNQTRLKIDSSGRLLLGGTSSFADTNSDDFQIEGSAHTGMIIKSGTSHFGSIYFGDSTSANSDRNRGIVRYGHSDDAMEFWTAASERVRIDSSGNLGINQTSPNARIEITDTNTAQIRLGWNQSKFVQIGRNSSGHYEFLSQENGSPLVFGTAASADGGGAEKMRIDRHGRLLQGITSARGNFGNNTSGVEVSRQLEGTSYVTACTSIIRNSNDGNDGGIILGKTRAGSVGGNTTVQSGDFLGEIMWAGADGTTLLEGARIDAVVESGVGNDDMPTSLRFLTNSGTTSPTERLRITAAGRVRIGASTDEDIHTGEGADLQVVSTDAGGLTFARDDTTVSNGANLGVISAWGNDNNGTYQEVAKIELQADLNHGTNDKPGRLVFSTTSDGGSSTTERLRIDSTGDVRFAGTNVSNSTNKNVNLTAPSWNTGEEDVNLIQVENEQTTNQISFGGGTSGLNAATTLRFLTASAANTVTGTERLRIDSSGKFCFGTITSGYENNDSVANFVKAAGAGTENPLLTLWNPTTVGDARASIDFLTNTGSGTGRDGAFIRATNNGVDGRAHIAFGELKDETYTERMRLTSSGELFVNTTSSVDGNTTKGLHVFNNGGSMASFKRAQAGAGLRFIHVNTLSGWIELNSNNTVSYTSASDYRLKENNVPISDGIARVKNLKPYRFNWKAEPDKTVDGFFAHEAQEVVPESATRSKDRVVTQEDLDTGYVQAPMQVGDPIHQSMDNAKLVPLLTAALQEAIAKIETLETEVAALKAA